LDDDPSRKTGEDSVRGRRFVATAALGFSALLVAVTIGVATDVAAGGAPKASMDPTRAPARFVARCLYSHTLSDDPIVKYNQPGASHSHDFFGNRTTNAASTLQSLSKGGTTCINRRDKSGYWVPSLTVDGQTVLPRFASIYYANAGKPYRSIRTIPRGLKVVAGNAMATTPQSLKIASWNCGADEEDVPLSSAPPTCPGPTLTMHVAFPDCWNGRTLDSGNHQIHLAYHNRNGSCPKGYPVPIPRLRINVHYPTTGGPGVAVASGGQYSAHADFFNAWNAKELRRLVHECINAGRACNARESL
jgi:hypothetical protein